MSVVGSSEVALNGVREILALLKDTPQKGKPYETLFIVLSNGCENDFLRAMPIKKLENEVALNEVKENTCITMIHSSKR